MRKRLFPFRRLILILGCGLAACTGLEGTEDATEDGHVDVPETLSDARDPLVCDAIYVPLVTFTFTDTVSGKPYCGPATVRYEVVGGGESHEVACGCLDDAMVLDGLGPCHVNPPEGETSIVTVSVPGYEVFETEVTLPYECHPQVQVDVLLRPSTGPLPECSGNATMDLGAGPDGCAETWIHGEQMCTYDVWCGLAQSCLAYIDWPLGTCTCGDPRYEGDVSILFPPDYAVLDVDDDVDADAPGLQIEVLIDAGCWMDYDFEWYLTLGVCGDPQVDAESLFRPDPTGRAERMMDLSGMSGTVRICAWPVKDGEISWGASVSVSVQ